MNQTEIKTGIDPLLTGSITKTRANKFNAGDALFPDVPVQSRSGTTRKWGDESFQLVETKRAPGDIFNEVDISISSDAFNLKDQGLATSLAVENGEEAKAVSLDLVTPKVNNIVEKIRLSNEKKKADLALNTANYAAANKVTLAGVSQWSDAASTPKADVQALVEAIEDATGEEVNTMVFSKLVFRQLQSHPDVIAAAKVLGLSEKTITTANLADFFDIKNIVVSTARYKDAVTGVWTYFWGKDVVLASVGAGTSMEYVSLGYNYQMAGYPNVAPKYWDNTRDRWVWKVKDCNAPIITSANSGALITDAVA